MLKTLKIICTLIISSALSPLHATITVDGKLNEEAWKSAQIIDSFKTLEPLNLEPAKYATEVRVLSSKEGIYLGFTNHQPQSVPRVRTSFPRDSWLQADRNVIMIDFDGNANAAYEFTVSLSNSVQDGIVTNEKQFRYDWDGTWYHQTHEQGDYWYTEVLIPWSSVPMVAKEQQRDIKLYVARVVHHEKLRFAYPDATWERATFLSDLAPMTIDSYSQQTIDFFPYLTTGYNNIEGTTEFKAGIDMFWKPTSNQQLSVAINPDFGQVESDSLVVNFSAFETFFPEKRPFFTENQSLFTKQFSNGGNLVHTRRIGAAGDLDGAGVSDIDYAIKYSQFGETLNFGAFIAQEDDIEFIQDCAQNADCSPQQISQGRSYGLTRVEKQLGDLKLGHFLTYTDRPAIDRTAVVNEIDADYQINDESRITSSITHTDIEQDEGSSSDYAVDLTYNTVIDDTWNHDVRLIYIGDDFELNDLGFMHRNDLIRLFGNHSFTNRQFSSDSLLRNLQYKVQYNYRTNTEHERLESFVEFGTNFNFQDTSRLYVELKRIFNWLDDRTMQDGRSFKREKRWGTYWEYNGSQQGQLRHTFRGWTFKQEFGGVASQFNYQPTWYINDQLSINGRLAYTRNNEWLIWRNYDEESSPLTDELVSFKQKQANWSLGLNWQIASKQELRLKYEWIAIKADAKSGYQPEVSGYLVPTAQQHTSFELSNTAIQLRYRYELAPLSNLYVVWSRGGNHYQDQTAQSFGELLERGWSEKTDDQFLIKIRYRF